MRENENVKTIHRFFDEVLNQRNLSLVDEFISDEYIEHGPTAGEGKGIVGVREHIHLFFNAFTGTHYRLEDTIAQGEKVVARWTLTGMHTGKFADVLPSGQQVEASGIDIYYFEHGKISEHWHEIDMLRLMTELKRSCPQ